MLSGQAQAVRGHPGILHQCLQIGDVAVSAKARSGQALDPGGHSIPTKVGLQDLLQSLPMQRREASQTVHRGQTWYILLACTEEEPPVTRPVGAMQWPRAEPV